MITTDSKPAANMPNECAEPIPTPRTVDCSCPNCGTHIAPAPEHYECDGCGERYPVVDSMPLLFNPADRTKYRLSEDTVQAYYRNVADAYSLDHHVGLAGAKRFLGEYEANIQEYLNKDSDVLEIGAGTGFATSVIRNLNPKSLTVTDASLEMLGLNHKQHPDLQMYCCPTENLPFPENTFDAVLGNNTFYLVPDKQTAAHQIARILKPGGRLILSEMNPHHPLWPMMFTIKGRFFERTIYKLFPGQMKRRFAKAGMTLEKVDFYSYSPYFANEALLSCLAIPKAVFGGIKLFRRFTAIRTFYVLRKE